ncbi:MAG: hypothetical protein ABR576_08025 [Thermoanaerobaculia bacterium]
MTFDEAKDVLRAFHREGVRYALVGSMAMAAQGIVRATRDMDVFVSPDPEKRGAAQARPPIVVRRPEHRPDIGRRPHRRISRDRIHTSGRAVFDGHRGPAGKAFGYEDIETEELTVDDFSIRVATPRMLWRMKKDTVRPQDRVDAEAIRRGFKLDE